ncbi:MAG: Ldh family oxidoreductase [Candidatus Bathyarchaeia archaeon]
MVRIKQEPLKKLSIEIFKAAGASEEEAEIVSEILVATSLHGIDSHGVRAIPGYVENIRKGRIRPGAKITVLKETETTAMLDDGGGFGFVAGKKAMEMAISKAKRYKMGSVGVKGPGHIGALYYYSLMAVKEDMIGITLCRGGGHGAVPYGAVEGRLGINPFSIGFPTGKERPVIIDMATTGVAMGHLDVMAVRGQKAPEGWLIKKDGTWETDPSAYRTGKASPTCFGYPYSEYKGYCLSVAIEAWAGAIGSGCSLDEKGFGHVFTAIDPTGYCPIDEFKARMDSMVKHIKSAARRPGFKEILLPGEPEWIEEEKRRKEGIFIDDLWWESICKTAKSLGVDVDLTVRY